MTDPKPTPENKPKEAKYDYFAWLKFNRKLIDPAQIISREIMFGIVVFLSAFSVFWGWGHGWKLYLQELNPNLFHEILGTITAILVCVWAYFHLYRTSNSYTTIEEAKAEAARKAKAAKKAAAQAKKDAAFVKIVVAFESAKTFEEKIQTMGSLLEVGLQSPSLRQRTINALVPLNQWMVDNQIYLRTQNLVTWRIQNELFETSSRLQENAETQDASIKVINIVESIIKRHLEEFIAGHNTETLDLSKTCLPTLSLSAREIPAGSLKFEEGFFWQSTFSESTLEAISFKGSDLTGTSFWRADLKEVDFAEVTLDHGKLRTNLQHVKNLGAKTFFATKEWELCLLSIAQDKEFFGDPADESTPEFSKWISSKIRRDKLYFGVDRI